MFNPHIHQQHQQQQHQQHQQQQFHQHLRQIQQLFQQQQQQPPPPPPQPPPQHQHHVQHRQHHHQAPRPMPAQAAAAPRMVNLCQATQTTIIAPNPMLQGALLMQQMQGNMRGFAMGGQQFRQFFSAGARSSLLGPVPMGMTMKSPLMGFPGARHYHPHHRFYNNNNNLAASTSSGTDYRQPDRKRDNEQRAAGSAICQSAASGTADTGDKLEAGGAAAAAEEASKSSTAVVDLTDEPVLKKPRTEGSEEPAKDTETITLDSDNAAEDTDCTIVEEVFSTQGSEVLEGGEETGDAELSDECLADDSLLEEEEDEPEDPEAPAGPQDDQDMEGTNKFYCYLCSITCHSQQNFRSHMNGISHQQRMTDIQHMSNACLVTLLSPPPPLRLQAAHKDSSEQPKHWCPSCGIHLSCGASGHRCNKEHKLTGPSCTVCQQSFKSSQLFVEHMRSQEHQRRVQQEKRGLGARPGMSAFDGLLKDPEDGSAVEGEEPDDETPHGSYRLDYQSAQTEVTLERMSVDEEYQADTAYGSRFLVPVAGFLCRLCNKFYHFESSALHSHCKSLAHFEHLKKYKALKCSQQDSSPTAGSSEDRLGPVTELERWDGTADPAASGDPSLPAPPVAPQESQLTTAKEVPTQEEEEEEEKLLSQDPSDHEAPLADALLAEEAPLADALLAEEAPLADALLAEEAPAADVLLAEEAPAADALLAEEAPAADVLLAEEAPSADPLLAEEAPAADALLAEEVPADDALLAEEAPAADALLAEGAPAADALLAEEAPPVDTLLAEEAPAADALLVELKKAEEVAGEEEKEAPETSTAKVKAPPKRRSRRR